MKKILSVMTLIWVLVLTGCPKDSKSALESGFAASVRVSSYGTDVTRGFTQLRRDGAITKEVFDSVISKLEMVGLAGRRVHTALAGFVERYPSGVVPASEFKPVALLFNSDIYEPIIELLGVVAALSKENQALLSIAMAGLKLAVNTIRSLMNRYAGYLGLPKEINYAAA